MAFNLPITLQRQGKGSPGLGAGSLSADLQGILSVLQISRQAGGSMYDFIGDIHGHAERLIALLEAMGYRETETGYSHPARKAFFIGDLIDRGPSQVATLKIVKAMVESGAALMVLGNHEYNAVAWATPHPDQPGEFLRNHGDRNRHQHQAFLDQVGEGSALHQEMIAWFKTLPVFIETTEFRAIHACWHSAYIDAARPFLDANNAILPEAWPMLSEKDTEPYHIIETLLKGTEVDLPEGITYFDPDGNERNRTRTRWWDEQATTYRSSGMVAKSVEHQLPDTPIPGKNLLTYDQRKLLLFGHYWMTGAPQALNAHMACLDYSIGKGTPGTKLCAYRWQGERQILQDGFVWVDAVKPAKHLDIGEVTP